MYMNGNIPITSRRWPGRAPFDRCTIVRSAHSFGRMGGIFIGYRRDDASGDAGRLYDRLSEHFGAARVFRDVEALRAGERFPAEIEGQIADCDVFIALMGDRWMGEGAHPGETRIQDPRDWVRLELAAALRREIPVIPALLDDIQMPSPAELPEDLRALTDRQAIELGAADFHTDVTRLIEVLEGYVTPTNPVARLERRLGWGRMAAGTGLALVLIAAVTALLLREGPVRLRSEPTALSVAEVRALIVEQDYYTAQTHPGGQGLGTDYRASVESGVPVVFDATTGLTWQQGGSEQPVSGGQEGAASYVRKLNEAAWGGHDDWRLPTLDEALSLLRPETTAGFHLAPAFDALSAPFIWTADAWRPDQGVGPNDSGSTDDRARGWVVYYLDGYATPETAAFNAQVRAVRGP